MTTQATAAPLIAMRGAGYYSDNTIGAKAVIDAAGQLVVDALAAMDLSGTAPFAIADFGAADGGTSLDLMKRVVETVRAASPDRPLTLTYTDLPHNDFSVLFRRLHGLLNPSDASPLGQRPNLYTFASGTSFHRQIFPDETLSLGFSATAMHWLSRRPCPIADHVHMVGASPAERALYKDQAQADWTTILLARARELVPGGKLVLANFCIDPAGRYLGGTGGVDMFDSFARHWRTLRATGTINEDEYRAGTLQQSYRTIEEFKAPLEDPTSPVWTAGTTARPCLDPRHPMPLCGGFREPPGCRALRPCLRSDAPLLDREHLPERSRSFARGRRSPGHRRPVLRGLRGGGGGPSRGARHGLRPLLLVHHQAGRRAGMMR